MNLSLNSPGIRYLVIGIIVFILSILVSGGAIGAGLTLAAIILIIGGIFYIVRDFLAKKK